MREVVKPFDDVIREKLGIGNSREGKQEEKVIIDMVGDYGAEPCSKSVTRKEK